MSDFKCGICGLDGFNTIYELPISRESGKISALPKNEAGLKACRSCAEESGLLCEIHGLPLEGFNDGTTLCNACVCGIVFDRSEEEAAGILLGIGNMLLSVGDVDEQAFLMEKVESDSFLHDLSKPRVVLRYVARKALREHVSLDRVLGIVRSCGSISYLFV